MPGTANVWLRIFDTLKRTPIRESKMNALARAQLTFEMLTLLKKILYHQSQYSITWDNKCLALIAQVVRQFGMNPKVGDSSPPQVETFCLLNLRHFHENIHSWVENKCCCPCTVDISNVTYKTASYQSKLHICVTRSQRRLPGANDLCIH